MRSASINSDELDDINLLLALPQSREKSVLTHWLVGGQAQHSHFASPSHRMQAYAIFCC